MRAAASTSNSKAAAVVLESTISIAKSGISEAAERAESSVPLSGSELTIELTRGANGPIQDRLILSRAMLLIGR